MSWAAKIAACLALLASTVGVMAQIVAGLALLASTSGAMAQTDNPICLFARGSRTASQFPCKDYDGDDDGLIDVRNQAQLAAITHDLTGAGNASAAAYGSAFPEAINGMGCFGSCQGYELLNDITLTGNWTPIGGGVFGHLSNMPGGREAPLDSIRYKSTFDGKGHTISGLRIQYSAIYLHAGLFRALGTGGKIRNVGLKDVSITRGTGRPDGRNIGALVGYNAGKVAASYALGSVAGDRRTGGLVGDNQGTIIASYANVIVNANGHPAGGLTGVLGGSGKIIASYALGRMNVRLTEIFTVYGGLVGEIQSGGTITNSYSVGALSMLPDGVDSEPSGVVMPGLRLRDPTAATGIYAGWTNLNVDDDDNDSVLDVDLNDDNPWLFGRRSQFPVLRGGSDFRNAQLMAQPRVSVSLSGRVGDGQITEGSAAMYAVELSSYSGGTVLNWAVEATGSGDGHATSADFETTQGTVNVAFASSAVFGVAIKQDALREGRESFRVRISIPGTARAPGGSTGLQLGSPSAVVSTIAADGDKNYDADADGLIDVTTTTQLHAIRYDESGAGLAGVADADVSAYEEGFPSFDHGTCAGGCTGYELLNDLDFNTGDAAIRSDDLHWNGGRGWEPFDYAATFDGNGHVISNLYIDGNVTGRAPHGLFGALNEGGVIRGVGLVDAHVESAGFPAGALAGFTAGGTTVTSSYAVGGMVIGSWGVGGLVGDHEGMMVACYAAVPVRSRLAVGSLVGAHSAGGRIVASYGIGRVHTTEASSGQHGALIGFSRCPACTVVDSYYDSARTGWFRSAGGTSKTTSNLQTPVSYSDTAGNAGQAIYSGWNVDVDDDGVADDPWDFGTFVDYPVLRGTTAGVARQFAAQGRTMLSFTLTGPTSVVEGGASTAQYTVSISDVLPYAATMQWSVGTATGADGVAPGDFADASGMRLSQFPSGAAVIPANSSRTMFSVYIFDDEDAELRERFVVSVVSGEADLRAKVIFEAGSGSTAVTSIEFSDGNDYDGDNDGLIDVATTSQLAAIRYDLGGRGLAGVSDGDRRDYLAAFDVFDQVKTCPEPAGCAGYELLNDIDLASVSNWTPIGKGTNQGNDDAPADTRYQRVFDGNGHVIKNMRIVRSVHYNHAGLFSALGASGTIRSVGLVNPVVDLSFINTVSSGGLVGTNYGTIAACYVLGGSVDGYWVAGGLVGRMRGGIVIASYTDVSVGVRGWAAGGLTGAMDGTSIVSASYAIGIVRESPNPNPQFGGRFGGLVGEHNSTNAEIRVSYFDSDRSGQASSCCGHNPPSPDNTAKASFELREPTSAMGIYAGWDKLDVDGVDQGGDNDLNDDAPWDFGGPFHYPVLVFGGDAGRVAARRTSQQEAQPALILTSTLVGVERVSEGATATYVVSLERSLPPGVSASWRWMVGLGGAITGGDFERTMGPVAIEAGRSSASFSLGVRADGDTELAEVFEVSLGDARLGGNADNASLRVPVSGVRTTIEPSGDLIDYDGDNDGLIDVTTTAQLAAITYDLDARGLAGVSAANRNAYLAAFDFFDAARTCPTTNMCSGYELLNDLDISGEDWKLIGGGGTHEGAASPPSSIRYKKVFEGNGHVISGLTFKPGGSPYWHVGLFRALDTGGVIRNVGLTGVDINIGNGQYVGSLVGYNAGKVAASYAVGWMRSNGTQGGLVGDNQGEIIAGYANVTVVSRRYPGGGLAGRLGSSGKIIASYALGQVDPKRFQSWANAYGGLVGDAGGEVTDSYYAIERGGLPSWAHDNPPSSRRMSWDLYTPTSAVGIYAGWDRLNVDDTSGTVAGVMTYDDDSPWYFGDSLQYPVLVFGGDAGSELARRTSQQEAHPDITWPPTLGGDAMVSEDATARYVVSLPVTLSRVALSRGVTASWSWMVVGAVGPDDFADSSRGRVVLAPGVSSASFSLEVAADGDAELAEVFRVSLHDARLEGAPDNVNPGVAATQTTIAANEFGQITVEASSATVAEGASATFTLRLSGAGDASVTVEFKLVPVFGDVTPADLERMNYVDHNSMVQSRAVSSLSGNDASTGTVALSMVAPATVSVGVAADDVSGEGGERFGLELTGCTNCSGRPVEIGFPSSAQVTISEEPLLVLARVYLQGAYAGSSRMSTNLTGFLPRTQPYAVSPWHYRTTTTVPHVEDFELGKKVTETIVDWVLVELRASTPNAGAGAGAALPVVNGFAAGLLLSDGRIAGIEEGATTSVAALSLEGVRVGAGFVQGSEVYVLIHHRNHLPVMSARPASTRGSGCGVDYCVDFRRRQSYVGCGQLRHADGNWLMTAGDTNRSGAVSWGDDDFLLDNLGLVLEEESAAYAPGGSNYPVDADLNFDGQISPNDYRLITENNLLSSKECAPRP